MPVSVGLLLVFPRPPGAFSGGIPKKGKPTSRKSFSVTPVAGDYYYYYYYYYYYFKGRRALVERKLDLPGLKRGELGLDELGTGRDLKKRNVDKMD